MSRQIQNEDIKTEADLTGAGGTKAQLPNDTKVYVSALGINDTLYNAIVNGQLSGGAGLNLISSINSSFENNSVNDWLRYQDAAGTTPVDGTGGTPSANQTIAASSSTPLHGTYSLLETKSGSANLQGYGFSLSSISVPLAFRGQNMSAGFYFTIASGTYTSGDKQIWPYDETNGTLLYGDIQSLPSTVTGVASKFVVNFNIPSNCSSIRFIVHQSTTTTNNFTIEYDDFFVSPIVTIQGPAIGDWSSYTPSFTGFGSPTNINMQWRRDGSDILIQGYWQIASFVSTQAAFSMPNSLKVRSSFRNASNFRQNFGVFYQWASGPLYIYNNDGIAGALANQPSDDNQVLLAARVDSSEFFNDNSGTWTGGTNWIYVNARVPIEGWASNIALANSQVEYASNSGMGDTNDTTSFVNDINGNLIPTTTYTSTRNKRIRFKNPIQPTDTIVFQVLAGSFWINLAGDVHDTSSTSLLKGYNGDVGYGMGIYTQINTTDIDIAFAQYQEPATSNWSGSNTSRWRVVKYSNAVPVESGFNTSHVIFLGGNGHGSTFTFRRTFNSVTNIGDSMTGTLDTTNGDRVTILKKGTYSMFWMDRFSGSVQPYSFVRNQTVNQEGSAETWPILIAYNNFPTQGGLISVTLDLDVGDVINMTDNNSSNNTIDVRCVFTRVR